MHCVASAREDLAAAHPGRAMGTTLRAALVAASCCLPHSHRPGRADSRITGQDLPCNTSSLPACRRSQQLWEPADPSQHQVVQDLVLCLQMTHRDPGLPPRGQARREEKLQPTCRGLSSSACPPVGQHTFPGTPELISPLDPQGGPHRESSLAQVDVYVFI